MTTRSSATTRAMIDHRLGAQQIARHDRATPAAVVAWMGAVQAQDYLATTWAVGLRLGDGATEAAVEQALVDGAILRTHAMRWTWQLVAPADVHWLLALVRPRLLARAARRNRELGLTAATFRRSSAAIEQALAGGRLLTRDQLAAALRKAGIATTGQRLPHLLAHAELDALICGGARGSYKLVDDRAPLVHTAMARDEALAELARRYFTSRGPATLADFTWWSGLSAADARGGLESVKSTLACDVIAGHACWRGDGAPAPARSRAAYLLPAFDEYLVAYRDRSLVIDPAHARRVNAGGGMLGPCVVLGGRVIGTWRRVLARTTVAIELRLFEATSRAKDQAIAAAARRYGAFLGLEARIGLR